MVPCWRDHMPETMQLHSDHSMLRPVPQRIEILLCGSTSIDGLLCLQLQAFELHVGLMMSIPVPAMP